MAPTPKKATPSKSPAAAPKLSTASKKTENKSILSDFGGLYFNLFVLALAVAVYAVDNYAGLKALLPPPAATKPFSTFKDFFPFYLKEHSNPINRGLHCIGTSLATTIALAYPPTILAMLVAGAC